MRALVIDRTGTLSLCDRKKPGGSGGECVIRVTAAGICGTDLELLRGYAGFEGIPGHEFVGVVEDAPAEDRGWIGKRVVGEITVGCGRCRACRTAGRGHCEVRTVVGIRSRDGAFAEYLSLPAANLHALPESLPDTTAVFVEPTAAACRVVEQVRIDSGTRAAVVGAGRLGLLIAQVLRASGARPLVIARGERGRSIAASLGFETSSADAAAVSHAFDVVVDATGNADGLIVASRLVRPRGTIVVKSTFHGETPVNVSSLVVDEITVVGSRCGPFDRAIELLDAGRVDVTRLLEGIYPLEQFREAFQQAERGLKTIFSPTDCSDTSARCR
jgi:threonine dehydrogenase-like Zn-dependent dehydrogenase